MLQRNEKVEKQFVAILNELLRNAHVTAEIGGPKVGDSLIPLIARGEGQPEKEVGYLWPEPQGAYSIQILDRRKLFINYGKRLRKK